MQERKELLRSMAEKSLKEIVVRNGGDPKKSIFDNLAFLTTEFESFGEKRYYIPLSTKETLVRFVDPDVRFEYETKFSEQGAVQVICRLYWSDCETPSGTGICTRYLSSIFRGDSLSEEERREKWVKTVMSIARGGAIRDAMAISAYDFDETERQNRAEEEEILRRNVAKAAKKSKKTAVESAPVPIPESVTDAATDTLPFEEEKVEKEEKEPASAKESEVSDEIAAARDTVADLGQFKGYPLGEIYDKNPKGLLWLINRGSAVSEQARVLVLADEELAKKL